MVRIEVMPPIETSLGVPLCAKLTPNRLVTVTCAGDTRQTGDQSARTAAAAASTAKGEIQLANQSAVIITCSHRASALAHQRG